MMMNDAAVEQLMTNLQNYQHILMLCHDNAVKQHEAIQRVRDIHSPSKDDKPGCMGCGTDPDYWDDWRETWPCPTIRALDGEQK